MSDPRSVLSDGESIIVPAGNHVELVCCDCALVHDVWPSYDAQARMISLMFVRNNDKTKVARRKKRRKKEGIFKGRGRP